MPSTPTGPRIDWYPGPAALQALGVGEELYPQCNRQEVIDRLVITAVSAILAPQWQPPPFPAGTRHRWPLPADVASSIPEKGRALTSFQNSFPGKGHR